MAVSKQNGMGSIPYNGGTAFRVWAPNAQAVTVTGEFNHWSDNANPLLSEGNGYWYGEVAGAKVGQEYRYIVTNGVPLSRNDPYTRKVTSTKEHENSVIHSRTYS